MKKNITAIQTIENLLLKQGYVDNFYCIDKKITTRLGAVILKLKSKGWIFDENKSGYYNNSKNWRYVAKKSPYVKVTYTLSNGEKITKLVKK